MAKTNSSRAKLPRVRELGAPFRGHPLTSETLRDTLKELAIQLEWTYSTCVTAQLALNQQGADQDRDIEACLQWHVSEPVIRISRALRELSLKVDATGTK